MTERKAISEKKKAAKELAEKIKKYPNIILVNLKHTPTKLVQKLRKKLKDDKNAYVSAHRKAVLQHSFEEAGLPKEMVNAVDFPAMVILVDENPYRVNLLFMGNKLDVAAKAGDVAPFDIVVPAGETDLTPGPTLSQLKMAGIHVKIDKGKIVVDKDSVVAKAGDVITPEKAQALQVLGIKPFKVGMTVSYAYDGKTLFTQDVLNLSLEDLKAGLEEALQQSLNASINVNYPTSQNVKVLLTQAIRQGLNAGLNASYYSEATIDQLLTSAIRQANALPKGEEGG